MIRTTDERQASEMIKIGNICFYIVWYALLLSILLQLIIWKATAQQIAAELIVFLLGGILMIVLLIYKGLWGFFTKPNKKTYIVSSAITGIVIGAIVTLLYDWSTGENDARQIMWVFIFAILGFAVCYALLALTGLFIRKRQKRLGDVYDKGN